MKDSLKVLFPVTDLARHGAQRQLLELVKGLDKKRFNPIVLTLCPGGAMEAEFKQVPGVRVICLERKGKFDFMYLLRVAHLIRKIKVDVVQPFLTPATLWGLLPALLCRTPVTIATERLAQRKESRGYSLYLKVEDFLSRFADWVVPNSGSGKEYLIKRHIKPDRIKIIYNGLNLSRLNYDDESAARIRREMGVPPEGKVVGIMARLFPQKDHATFLKAAAIINRSLPETRFALVGDGPLRGELENLSQQLGLASKVVFFGEQEKVGDFLSAFDVAVLTSESEGCSNSLLETMALGKPVVANDVGGNRELVQHGVDGLLVPFGDAEAAADAILSLLLDSERAGAMGRVAKEKITTQFSLEKMVRQYQSLYETTFSRKRARKTSSAEESCSGAPSPLHGSRGRS